MKLSIRGALLLGSCLSAGSAIAQDADDVFLGTIRIDAASAQAVLGNSEITTEEVEERNPSTTADIFKGDSSVTASGGAPIAQKVFVNGIEESLLSVTIDGARQNKGAFHHAGNVLFDPTLLKSVEVSEGIAPADAGPNALAGGLAYTTKDAHDFLTEDETFGGLASVRGTDNGDGFRRSLTLFGQEGGFEWLLSATKETGDEYEGGDGDTVPGTEADLTAYVLKLGYTTDSGKRFTFSASETEDTGSRVGQASGSVYFIRPDFAEVIGRDSVYIDGYSRRTSYTMTYQDENPAGVFAPKLQLSYNEQEVDVSAANGLNTSLSGVAENEFLLSNGTITAGLDFFHETAEGDSTKSDGTAASGEEELDSIGLFAQARQDLTDRLSVSYGGRLDHQSFEGADGSEFDESGVSANASLDYKLTDTLTLNAGVASSWGGYELGEAAIINYTADWNYDGFATSRSNSARIGLRYETGPWAVSGAIFNTDIRDLAAVLPSSGERGALSDMSSRGFDGSITYTGGTGFAKLNYTYADVDLDGDDISSTAYYYGRPVGHIIALSGAYDLSTQWRVGGSAEIALEDDETSYDLPGYEVMNAYVSYKPTQLNGLELRLDVENLFDQTYVSRSSDGVGLANVVALNEPGRTISLTANMRF